MLGIIGAMQEEVEQLISAMNVTKGEKKAEWISIQAI